MSSDEQLDLTIGVLGTQVPATSKTITWNDGLRTVLPTICNESNKNLCDEVDIPLIKFMAQFPRSNTNNTAHVHMAPGGICQAPRVDAQLQEILGMNKCVVIKGVPHNPAGKTLTFEYLDAVFGISPHRPVCIHDMKKRCEDHVHPTITGSIGSFIESINDTTSIQCILDIPLAHVSLPDGLKCVATFWNVLHAFLTLRIRILDHGLVHGWNQTTHSVPIISKVHPENFTIKGWGLLHHAGFLTYPHHDAEGTLTWVRMEAGLKLWVIFRLKSRSTQRIHLQELAVKLTNYPVHKDWLQRNCEGEVITLRPGDLLILPPGMVHAVYTPIPSFATGGHFYNYSCMHLTELSRYIDAEVAESTTNQALDHALETLRRMVIMIPYLSPRLTLRKRCLLSLCMMATRGRQYRAKGSSPHSVEDTETAEPSADISDIIFQYFGLSNRMRPGDILYVGNQHDPGDAIDRVHLLHAFKNSLVL
ncbi:hypothetical protein DFJ58DRAFT_848005 [Suillus subalutaceus]|uniref:uncharacterized protein n=1 Tax=Suillus subalutaceus TaxID=48586 RepID=UPI001B882AF4|nr:uncharacterized protein DFJ58DRAFT_848005 [Suillus subalutaceus]KAG1832554.1 hypothetical protein DFJ58DRAFT_848005 [Suillus subalutaceus]